MTVGSPTSAGLATAHPIGLEEAPEELRPSHHTRTHRSVRSPVRFNWECWKEEGEGQRKGPTGRGETAPGEIDAKRLKMQSEPTSYYCRY